MTNKIINPIHVREGEYVDIHWRLKDGNVFIERRSCPPSATTEARQAAEEPTIDTIDVTLDDSQLKVHGSSDDAKETA